MTITRMRQTGFELNDLANESSAISGTAAVSTLQKKTGNYALSIIAGGVRYVGFQIPTTAQARCSFHIRGQSPASGDNVELCSWYFSTSTQVIALRWNGTVMSVIASSATSLATAAYLPFATPNTWFHISMDVKLHATTGWVKVYIDGNLVINFSGNTSGGGLTLDRLRLGVTVSGQDWAANVYYDDLYIDDCAGEVAATFAPDRRFDIVLPSGNGASSQWTGNDLDSTDNYLLVDDIPTDGDASYVSAATAALKDTYDMNTITLPAGWSIAAIIPLAFAKKDSAGSALGIQMITRLSGVERNSATLVLGTDYTYVWDRHTLDPSGGSWSQADLDAVQVGMVTV